MPEQFHQRVDADVGVGKLGGEGVAQPMDECAAGAVGVDAGAAKRPQHPVLQGAAGNAIAIRTHEQRRRRRPRRQSPAGGGAPIGGGRKSSRSAVEIVLEDVDQRRLDGDPAVFAALAADVDDGAVVGAAKVTDVGAQQFIGAQPGQQGGEDQGAVAFDPVGAPLRIWSALRASRRAATESAGNALGSVLASLGRPTIGMGLAAISSAVQADELVSRLSKGFALVCWDLLAPPQRLMSTPARSFMDEVPYQTVTQVVDAVHESASRSPPLECNCGPPADASSRCRSFPAAGTACALALADPRAGRVDGEAAHGRIHADSHPQQGDGRNDPA